MSFELLLKFFGPVEIVGVPGVEGFDPAWFGVGSPNSDGVHIKQILWRFQSQFLDSGVQSQAFLPSERIYVGVARRHVPQGLVPFLGPIYLAQYRALFKMQPNGEKGYLTRTWWNSARIRGALSDVASARFSDSEQPFRDKTLFTMSSDPKGRGWIHDSLPVTDPKWYAQGRRIIFSEPIPG